MHLKLSVRFVDRFASSPVNLLSLGQFSCSGFPADVAQLVEQSIRNRQVIGSSPIVGSSLFI